MHSTAIQSKQTLEQTYPISARFKWKLIMANDGVSQAERDQRAKLFHTSYLSKVDETLIDRGRERDINKLISLWLLQAGFKANQNNASSGITEWQSEKMSSSDCPALQHRRGSQTTEHPNGLLEIVWRDSRLIYSPPPWFRFKVCWFWATLCLYECVRVSLLHDSESRLWSTSKIKGRSSGWGGYQGSNLMMHVRQPF